jgi:hypothetical protein
MNGTNSSKKPGKMIFNPEEDAKEFSEWDITGSDSIE